MGYKIAICHLNWSLLLFNGLIIMQCINKSHVNACVMNFQPPPPQSQFRFYVTLRVSTVQQQSQTAQLSSRWVYPAVHQHKWGPHGCPKRRIKTLLEYEMNLCVSCLSLLFRRALRYTLLHILLLNPLGFKSQVQAFECSSFCFCRSQVLSFPSFSPFFFLSLTLICRRRHGLLSGIERKTV